MYVVVSDSGQCFFLFHVYQTGAHGVTVFDQQTCEICELEAWWTCPHFINSKRTQNAEFMEWRSVTVKKPAVKLHSVPGFRHFVSLVGQKSSNLPEQTYRAHHLKVSAQLVPLHPSQNTNSHSLFKCPWPNNTHQGAVPVLWKSCCHSYVVTPPPMYAIRCPHSSCHTNCHLSSADKTHNLTADNTSLT